MSFQHFRLGQLAMNTALPPHLMNTGTSSSIGVMQGTAQNHTQSAPQYLQNPTASSSSIPIHAQNSATTPSKAPYGSGDQEDGYTLIFQDMNAFEDWRRREEESQMVDFVKGDTHGSKAVPPRFKSHTKLVCARHSRSGRKKYVKKHPERVRKVPSRKIEGTGCPASISFKTYFDREEIRACYNAEHSHPIGEANLMFTKRGRKAIAEKSAVKPIYHNVDSTSAVDQQPQSPAQPTPSLPTPFPQQAPPQVQVPAPQVYQQPQQQPVQQQQQQQQPQPIPTQPQGTFAPPQFSLPQSHQPHQIPMQQLQDRWENMSAIFTSVRETARGAMFDPAAVAALETLLLRMYFEASSGGLMGHAHHAAMGHMQQQHAGMAQQHGMHHLGQGQQGMGQQHGIGQGQQGMGHEQESSSDGDGSEDE